MKPGRWPRIDYERIGPFVALVILFGLCSLTSEYFLKVQNLLNILRQVSYTGIIAIGLTFVIIAGGIDLSVGSMCALMGGLSIVVLNRFDGSPGGILLGVLAALLGGILAGTLNGLIITKGRVAPFIATLGTMAVFRSLTLYMSKAGEFRSVSDLYAALGMGTFLRLPIPAWALLTLTVLFGVVLRNTPFGRHVCAVGANEKVALYSAIKVNTVRLITYMIAGLTVGVSSVLLAARLNSISSSNAGINFELDAIAAVIIGGTSLAGGSGTIVGTLIGALTLGIVNNMLNMWGVSPYLQGTVKGIVIIGAVLIQRKRRET